VRSKAYKVRAVPQPHLGLHGRSRPYARLIMRARAVRAACAGVVPSRERVPTEPGTQSDGRCGRDDDLGGDGERRGGLVVADRPGRPGEVVADGDRSAAADECRPERPNGLPRSAKETGRAGCSGREAGEAEQAAGGEKAARFVDGARDVVGAEEIEDVGGEEAIEAPFGVGEPRQRVPDSKLDPVCVGAEASCRELVHVRAEVDAAVVGVGWEVVSKETLGEGAGAVADLADGVGVLEVCVRKKRCDRGVLVHGLQVLEAADPVVDAARLVGSQVSRRSSRGGR